MKSVAGSMTKSEIRKDALVIWDFHQLGESPVPSDVGIVLGSHDLGVADHAVRLHFAGYFPRMVFSGATSKTTVGIFPQGEAVAYRNRAIELGVSEENILIEVQARNTGDNFSLSRAVLEAHGIEPSSAIVVCKPYMQRRAVATAGKVWPELSVICASEDLGYEDYVETLGNEKLVIDMIVGDLQRILVYPELGFAVPQEVPPHVIGAFERLVSAGYTSRLLDA